MTKWIALCAFAFLVLNGSAASAQQGVRFRSTIDQLKDDVAEIKRRLDMFGGDEFGDVLTIRDSAGAVLLTLEVDEDGGLLSAVNQDGNAVTFLGVNGEGGGLLQLMAPAAETTAIHLSVIEGGGLLTTANPDGTDVAVIGADEAGDGIVNVNNAAGETVFLSVDEDGGRIDVTDNAGTQVVIIGADGDGQGYVSISGERVHDTAEIFDLATRRGVVPGTVMAADAAGNGTLRPAAVPYDRKAVGVISGAGVFRHGILIGARKDGSRDLPIALSGQVYVRVSTENGAIAPGDLLVSSSSEGVAMRATDMQLAFGSVIGKALESYSGAAAEGLVRMLVMVR